MLRDRGGPRRGGRSLTTWARAKIAGGPKAAPS